MIPSPNPGNRPSRLTLARYQTGEIVGPERLEIEAWLDEHPDGRAYLAELDALSGSLAPVDLAELRARADRIDIDAPPANRTLWAVGSTVMLVLAAAVALFVIGPSFTTEDNGIRQRGDVDLQLFTLSGDRLVPHAGSALGEGDVVGFRVLPGSHESVAVLSVDGVGVVSVLYPEDQDDPALDGDGQPVELPGSWTLDGAPGPEVFVAVFDMPSSTAQTEIEHLWQSGGHEAVLDWARSRAGVDALTVDRR
jgi:anti-sigma factor RsiW